MRTLYLDAIIFSNQQCQIQQMQEYEIRADYNHDSIVVYQAYNDSIADAALRNQRFVAPFCFHRMTWIKPS